MTIAARRILWEATNLEAATALGALVGRRVDLEQRVRGSRPAVWLRELADVQQAEASLRAALGVPADPEWVETELREAWGK